ncbi:hypothetical protein [Verrucomicrobium spinosum]|uniref:hypothetical protein n=1 Tax=Verrucomicrobium spinosum TaxID=2736 RepID=UPI0009465666|nr:hypothetical protein [Verrucomicrobium spinosum]
MSADRRGLPGQGGAAPSTSTPSLPSAATPQEEEGDDEQDGDPASGVATASAAVGAMDDDVFSTAGMNVSDATGHETFSSWEAERRT